ncbi:MAG: NADPH-dependent FMN reductase [Phycicoccus sp.]
MTADTGTLVAEATAGEGRLRVGIVVASTRPGRKGPDIAAWIRERARAGRHRETADFELVDLADHALHHLDEKVPAVFGDYAHDHTHRWSATVTALDAFVVVVPEYNHSFPGSLKTALDFLYAEWHDKAVGFVSYGIEGGSRAVEQLRPVMAELRLADVPAAVHLWLGRDSNDGGVVESEQLTDRVDAMLDDVVAWGRLLRDHREAQVALPVGVES